MKVRNSISFFAIAALIFSGSVLFTSCSDPVKGCTDPNAETYNADADESDATLCVYSRDKFIGDYGGTLICPGPLNAQINNSVYDFKIQERAGGTVSEVTVGVSVFGAPVNLAATVSGSTITIDQTIPNVPFTAAPGVTITATIVAKGTANLAADNKTLSGVLNVTITAAAIGTIADACPITGVKK
ncbi:MAG: hypothetical protein IPL23_17590 [Saprospiraceae bacterium]|nr:hypothetical protein [Saprospiraceae bacterium]